MNTENPDLAVQVASGAVTDVYLRGKENKVELFRHALFTLFLDTGRSRTQSRYSSQHHPAGGYWILHFPCSLGERAEKVQELITNATKHEELELSDRPFTS